MLMGHYGLYGSYLYDYHLNYPTHQCECLAILVYVWQSEYEREYVLEYVLVYIQSILLLKLLLLYFFGQINHLYDV